MKQQIDGFSRYYLEDGYVWSKKYNRKIVVNNDGCVQLFRDDGHYTTVGLRKILKGKQDYKQIEQEQNVKYKPVYGANGYMFCEDVEDQYKVYSLYNNYFLSPAYVKDHLRYTIRINKWSTTKFFYHLVWEDKNQKKFPKGMICHHKDSNPKNDHYDNLKVMTRAEHKRWHLEHDKFNEELTH